MAATNVARNARGAKRSDFMMGLLCGTAVGAIAGLLMATKTGKELRSDIAGSAQRIRRQVSDAYDQAADVVDRGRDAFRKGRASFDDVRARFDADDRLDEVADRHS